MMCSTRKPIGIAKNKIIAVKPAIARDPDRDVNVDKEPTTAAPALTKSSAIGIRWNRRPPRFQILIPALQEF
jgi:hypothetical protein